MSNLNETKMAPDVVSEALQLAAVLPEAKLEVVVDAVGNKRPAAVLPPGWVTADLSKMFPEPAPTFRAAKPVFHTIAALVEYVGRHRTVLSTVWLDSRNLRIQAVLDDGTVETPGRRLHTALYQAELAPEYLEWVALTKGPVSQKTFITFIEEHDRHFVLPTGATMRTLANQLEVKKGVSFKNVEREDSAAADVSLVYETQTTELGAVKCPSALRIRIPVFRQGAVYELEARLRFDLVEGQLMFLLRLPEQAKVLDTAWNLLADQLREKLGSLEPELLAVPVFEGVLG